MKKLLTSLLLIVVLFSLAGCRNDEQEPLPENYLFEMLGEEVVTVYIGDTYFDKGFIARYGSDDISDYVTASGDVNILEPGTYSVTYRLDHNGNTQTLTRTVHVTYLNIQCDDVMKVVNDNAEDSGYDKCSVTWSNYLNTVVTLNMYVEDNNSVNLATVVNDVEDILALYTIMSDKYTEYDYVQNVWAINQDPTATHTISESLFDLIEYTLDNQESVVDYYNAAMGSVLALWHDTRENCTENQVCTIPSNESLVAANQYTDPSLIVLDRENLTITMGENMALDLGGVSKGYVSKLIVEYLDTVGLYGYLLNNGQSNISIGGLNPRTDDGSFTIAVTDPTDPYDLSGKHGYAWVKLTDGDQLVTSGDYQKYYEVDGVIYHHIIDPVTLMPLSHSRSVSIITSDAALADLYSTAIFNMTIEEGKAFVNNIDGLEAIWYVDSSTIEFSTDFESDHLIELR